jgi:hypothetical protein
MILEMGAQPGPVYGKNGKRHLRERITGYNNAACFSPWIVLLDLDHDSGCAPPLRNDWLGALAPFMCLRIAVRQVEAWLLADRDNISRRRSVTHTAPRGGSEQCKGSNGGFWQGGRGVATSAKTCCRDPEAGERSARPMLPA